MLCIKCTNKTKNWQKTKRIKTFYFLFSSKLNKFITGKLRAFANFKIVFIPGLFIFTSIFNLIKMLKLSEIKKYCDFTPLATVVANGGVAVNYNVAYDAILKNMKPFMAPDGTTFLFYDSIAPSGGNHHYINLVVDVNGAKGPNKWGYDVFWLTFSQKNGNLMLADEYASLAEKGGRLPRTILRNSDIQPTRAGYDIQD